MINICVLSLGCKVNQAEADTIKNSLLEKNYKLVGDKEDFDIVVINTCAVTHVAEKKSKQLIRKLKRKAPNCIVIITGCFASTVKNNVNIGVDCIVYNKNKENIVKFLETLLFTKNIELKKNSLQQTKLTIQKSLQVKERTRAFIKIQDGCDNFCSYCIIPYVRGPSVSLGEEEILENVKKKLAAGFKEIILTGIHIGNYGKDKNNLLNLEDIVKKILTLPNLYRLRLSSIESTELSENLLNLFEKDKRLCRHLHLPLQSACDSILQKMNRKYKVEEYFNLLFNIKARFPDMLITTDIIVGFPGETENDFLITVENLKRMPLGWIHVFPFSIRQETKACNMKNHILSNKKRERVKIIKEISNNLYSKQVKSFLETEREVLFEGNKNNYFYGLTDNYLKIFVFSLQNLKGEIKKVKIQQINKKYIIGII